MTMFAFVYGTLKGDRGNHRVMYPRNTNSKPVFVGEAVTKDNFFVTTCGFPYVIHPDNLSCEQELLPVKGEVYEVDTNILRNMDSLEGYCGEGNKHNHYNRITITVLTDKKEEIDCFMYVSNSHRAENLPSVETTEFLGKKVYNY